jgi:inosine triphosphate pyrophosphatase
MQVVTYITGNPKKAEYLESYLGHHIEYKKVELDEIQSLDLREILEHKVRQAYAEVKGPVIVEDTSLEFKAFGRLPGPFIRFFVEEMDYQDICNLLINRNRNAVARCMYAYFDGEREEYFEGVLEGSIAEEPAGDAGFGFDPIFIPHGYMVTKASLDEESYKRVYMTLKPIAQLKEFLISLA